ENGGRRFQGGRGRQAGLHREDVAGEIAVALLDRIEARLRAKRREPRRPDMGRHRMGVGSRLQGDLKEVARVEAEDRPAVGGDVADARQPRRDAVDGGKIGRVDQVMDFPDPRALLVDGGDLDRQHEARERAAGGRKLLGDPLLDLRREAEQARLGRDQLLLELGGPGPMGEVARRPPRDALAARRMGEMLEVEVRAGRPRIFRVDVQIRMEAHGRLLGRSSGRESPGAESRRASVTSMSGQRKPVETAAEPYNRPKGRTRRMPMNKPHLEFHKVEMGEGWGTPPGYPAGIQQKILASDLDETRKMGSRTRLLRFAPGVYTTAPFVHDHWEEVYLLSGDLIVGNDAQGRGGKLFEAPTYACRPPRVHHCPFKSDHGCLLYEMHYYDESKK